MRDLAIAYGNNRQAKQWVNKTIKYEDLKDRLKVTIRTSESAEEYAKFSKAQRDAAKDRGGFVAGALKDGRRKVDSVESRSMVALDGDRIDTEFLNGYEEKTPYTSALYTTHSSTPENPRVRILFPLTRDVTPEEYVAVTRYVAQELGIDFFDECSYLPNQLMYWPSTPSNGEFIFKEVNKDLLDPDVILSAHPEWKDPTRLPTSSRESTANTTAIQKVQDPLEKNGVVGLFNRVYFPVNKALDELLPSVYEPTDNEDRYHLIESGSMPGVEIKDGGKFVYSHHAKDPAYLKLCNAFDIVRIHLFGDESDSFQKMCTYAMSLDKVKEQGLKEKQEHASEDFAEGVDWKKKLQYESKAPVLKNNLHNIRLILENDENLKGLVFNQLADGMEIKGEVPWKHPAKFWRDADDAQLISYVDENYGSFSQRNYEIAVTKVVDDRSYHPIREFLSSLPEWDGVKRVDSLLIDYLGAEDCAYTRAITRKILCAAVMRVREPGIKFDNILVLNGDQGIGKSTLIEKLGGVWYSDSLSLSDMNDKTAAEKLQGYWIHEIGELAGMKKADIDRVKAFISRKDDNYRAAFGRRPSPHPRQCIFFGTTNSVNGYLRDITGNRRFWSVKVPGGGKLKAWDMTDEDVWQIWAEVKVDVDAGEDLYLDPGLEEKSKKEQTSAMEQDDREGIVKEYLDMPLPDNWDSMDEFSRRDYVSDPNGPTQPKGVKARESVSNMEIWCECFGKQKAEIKPSDSYAIAAIMLHIGGWKRSDKKTANGIYGKQRLYIRT